ncbi:MAG: LamG domain-containing protein [Candidatus Heimdallarchaeaceae archaeon]
MVASQDTYQELTINDLKLSTWRSTNYVNEDFFFHIYMNLTMREWMDQSGIQKPAVILGPVLEFDQNTVGLAFDGIDDVVIVPNSRSLNPINELTIEIWIKFSSYGSRASGRDWFTLLSKGGYWGRASYSLLFAANTSDRTILFTLNGTRVASARTFAENNVWYHIVATFNGSFAKIFLNGESVASAPFLSNLADNAEDLYIGGEENDIYPLNGVVRALRIYNRALSQDEIKLSYRRQTLNSNGSLVLDLNLENLKYSLEKSEDGLNFREVFQSNIGQTIFSWKENRPGKYIYRIAMPSIENNTRIMCYSNICIIDIVQQEPKTSLVKLLYVCLLVLTAVICLYFSQKFRCKT